MNRSLQHLRDNDPIMASLIEQYGELSLEQHTDYYEELVGGIIGQQLSVKAAGTIRKRFTDLFGGNYPTPEELLTTSDESLRAIGLSYRKVSYVKDVARHIVDGLIDFKQFKNLSNSEIIKQLTAIHGIGEWTAHMFLMFCMARPNVLPTGDLGIKNAIQKLYMPDQIVTPGDITVIADRYNWRPHESQACLYLWKSLDNTPK